MAENKVKEGYNYYQWVVFLLILYYYYSIKCTWRTYQSKQAKNEEPVFIICWNSCHLGIIINRNAIKTFHSLAKAMQEESLCDGHYVMHIYLIPSIPAKLRAGYFNEQEGKAG